MTCIVGVAQDGKAYIGADSASSDGYVVQATMVPKVFRTGQFAIGYTSSFRMGQILQYYLDVQPQDGEACDLEYMVRRFVPAVRQCLKENGFAKVENNVESGGTFLVGYRGAVYVIDSDFQVNTYRDGFAACGCGEHYALGVLKALEDLLPDERVMRALEVSAHFSPSVLGPFSVIEV